MTKLPDRGEYYVATVHALQENGGIANIEEIETEVARILDLTPAALEVPHGDGRRTQFQYDLAWVRTYLKWGGAVSNPERGVWQLTEHGDSMSHEELRELWRGVVAEQRRKRGIGPPKLPKQGPGPHFEIEDGILSFAQQVDNRGNNRTRLKALLPIMQTTASDLVAALHKHEGLWPLLDKATQEYQRLLNAPLSALDFGRLFGQGLILANAVKAARATVADGNAYSLAPEAAALAESLLQMHGPFILATKQGQALVADATRFDSTSAELSAIRASELALSSAIAAPNAPAAQEVKNHVASLVASDETAHRQDYKSVYLHGVVQNASIILVGAAIVSVLAATVASGGLIPTAIGTVTIGIFGKKALENSKAGQAITREMTRLVDHSTVDFVLKNEFLFRQFAKQRHLEWLSAALDWALAQKAELPDDDK